jgi:hypothetical protein
MSGAISLFPHMPSLRGQGQLYLRPPYSLGLPYVRDFPDMSSFSDFRIVSGGGFFSFTKMSGFLAFVDSPIQVFGGRYIRYSS